MKYSYPFALALGLAAATATRAQNVGIGTANPNAAAALDITAASKGLLIPRLDSATRDRIANPPAGLLVYQTGPRAGFYYYAGTAWVFLPDKARAGDNLGNHVATRALALNGNQLELRSYGDVFHALEYNSTLDGPRLFGYNGGALGYSTGTNGFVEHVLRWTNTGLVSTARRLKLDTVSTNRGTAPTLLFGAGGTGEGIGSARGGSGNNLYGLDFYTSGSKRLTIGNGGTVSVGVAGTNTGSSPDLAFGGSGTGEGIGSARSSGNANQYGLDFYTGFAKRLSLTNTGNVGIGTAAPEASLDVNGPIWSRSAVRVDASDLNSGSLASGLYFGAVGSGEGVASRRTSGANQFGLDFYTNTFARLSITNTGYVGVGTTAPTSGLHVTGTVAVGVARNIPGSSAGTKFSAYAATYLTLVPANGADRYLLPAPASCEGRIYYVRNATTNTTGATYPSRPALLAVDGGVGGIVDATDEANVANASYTLSPTGSTKMVTLVSDGVNWTVIRAGL